MVCVLCAFTDGILTGLPDLSQPADEWGIVLDAALELDPAIWIDGRSESEFTEGHFRDALHLNFDNWDSGIGDILQKWEPGTAFVVYCEGHGCESSRAIAERLRNELELETVYWLIGGWNTLAGESQAQ